MPDDVHPDDVEKWLEDLIDDLRPSDMMRDWDSIDVYGGSPQITGTWEPEEGTDEHAAWLEAERLRPIPGQVDIFGRVV